MEAALLRYVSNKNKGVFMKYLNIAMLAVLLPFASSFASGGVCKQANQAIVKSCEDAGFVKGGHKTGKGLYKDCVQQIKAGQTVTGVTFDQSLLQACKNKRAPKATTVTPVAPSAPSTPVAGTVKTSS
jgi:hypothetical protein